MPAPLSEEIVARMKELRSQGKSSYEVAEILGVGRTTVLRHTRLPGGQRRSTHWREEQHVVDDWGYPIDRELLDVEPIPFYPDDLPDLQLDDFEWTQEELDDAVREAHTMLARQAHARKWSIRFPDYKPYGRTAS
jgi:hypothetical protein